LLPLVVALSHAGAPLAAYGVELVDEDYRRGLVSRLAEEVPDARRADAHQRLDEFRAGQVEDVGLRLARDRAGEKGLARARRPDEQHALRRTGAEPRVAGRILEVIADLTQLDQRLRGAGHVPECELALARFLPLSGPLGERGEGRALVAGERHEERE